MRMNIKKSDISAAVIEIIFVGLVVVGGYFLVNFVSDLFARLLVSPKLFEVIF